jgi:hypothetical protein
VKLFNQQSVGLDNNALKRGGVGLLQYFKEVSPQERLASGKTQRVDADSSDLVHKIDGPIGVDTVFPSGLPVIAADALRLAILG